MLPPSVSETLQTNAPRSRNGQPFPFCPYILWLILGLLFAAPRLDAQELELENSRMSEVSGFREASDAAAKAHVSQSANPSLAITTAQHARQLITSANAYPALYAIYDSYEAEAWLNAISGDEEAAIEKSISLAQESIQLLEKIPYSDMMIIHNLIVLGNAYLRAPLQDNIANSDRAFGAFRRADEMIAHLQPIYPKAPFTDCSGPDVLAGLLDAEMKRSYVSLTPKRFALRHYSERLGQFEGKVDRLCSAKSIAALGRVGQFSIEVGFASDDLFADTLNSFKDAIARLDPSQQPYLWANTERDYGMTLYLKDRLALDHDPKDELDIQRQALDALSLAESVFTKTSAPRQWALTEDYIGDVYIWRPSEEAYTAAYPHYLNALMVLGKERVPAALIHQTLADNLFHRRHWAEASREFEASFRAKQKLPDPNFLASSLQTDYEQDYFAYQKAAYSAIKMGEYQLALTYLMNADGRGLSERLTLELQDYPATRRLQIAKLRSTLDQIARLDSTFHDLHSTADGLQSTDQPISELDLARAQTLRNQARSLERTLHLSRGLTWDEATFQSAQLKSQKEPIIATAVTSFGAVVMMADFVKPLSSRNFVEVDELNIDSLGQLAWSSQLVGVTVIRSPERDIVVVKTPPLQAQAAKESMRENPGAFDKIINPNDDPAPPWSTPGIDPETTKQETRRAIQATQDRLKPLACAIVEIARRLRIPFGSNVHYVGSGLLTTIPLGASISRRDGFSTLDNDFAISFAPNITVLLATQRKSQRPLPERYPAIIYDPALVMSAFQAESLKSLGYKRTFIEDSLDTLIDPVKSVRMTDIAIAMHGHFERVEPWASRVTLAGKTLTMSDLAAIRLPKVRTVVLSSCDTGVKGFEEATSESVGFPELFLNAGATDVVATLWEVDDFATGVLMTRFYKSYLHESSNPSRVLQASKMWLQSSTRAEIYSFMKQLLPTGDDRLAAALQMFKDKGELNDHPFKDPYYWAAFTITGY